jgi:hypothetical protein
MMMMMMMMMMTNLVYIDLCCVCSGNCTFREARLTMRAPSNAYRLLSGLLNVRDTQTYVKTYTSAYMRRIAGRDLTVMLLFVWLNHVQMMQLIDSVCGAPTTRTLLPPSPPRSCASCRRLLDCGSLIGSSSSLAPRSVRALSPLTRSEHLHGLYIRIYVNICVGPILIYMNERYVGYFWVYSCVTESLLCHHLYLYRHRLLRTRKCSLFSRRILSSNDISSHVWSGSAARVFPH